ncbi:hypothetical protein SELMODRAFT_416839 [Selaginella moellendorffii]|uniref:Retrotransposon gag domain-containing protein n=1 Tax=Selaginella moellendorffii TaxID=88036 RepID=D8S0K2_SELML|nr:hypothetical protein SELMODRAFT_416839 [Selaginella moellendorffii]
MVQRAWGWLSGDLFCISMVQYLKQDDLGLEKYIEKFGMLSSHVPNNYTEEVQKDYFMNGLQDKGMRDHLKTSKVSHVLRTRGPNMGQAPLKTRLKVAVGV